MRGQPASAGRAGDGGPRAPSPIAGCSSGPRSLVLVESRAFPALPCQGCVIHCSSASAVLCCAARSAKVARKFRFWFVVSKSRSAARAQLQREGRWKVMLFCTREIRSCWLCYSLAKGEGLRRGWGWTGNLYWTMILTLHCLGFIWSLSSSCPPGAAAQLDG